ncbi:MAG: ATP-dependent dethiobiotin synthetase BioD [Gemmatales bacterium]|nr:MAG: ATP-dependent dethiobiotin synthetase BioD [Gemmatales bacterium]
MRGLFITGTDTGVGKTYVSAQVVRCLSGQGRRVAACKPVATGAMPQDGLLVSEDTRILSEAAGIEIERVTGWVFAEPVAPPVAARRHGVSLRLEEIVGFVRKVSEEAEFSVVEGIGGLLCPLTETATVADFARELGFPVVIVARRSLGTLNHTLLTLEAASGRNLGVAGIVVNETEPCRSLADETNVDELRRRIKVPILAVVPHAQGNGNHVAESIETVNWLELGAGV